MENEINWDEHKKEMRDMRKGRCDLFEKKTITELEGLGYEVRRMSPYHFRINGRLDIYPANKRWHDIKLIDRGDIRGVTFVGFIKQYLPL